MKIRSYWLPVVLLLIMASAWAVEDKQITPVEPNSPGISEYVLEHKEWIFDGWGTELVVFLVTTLVTIGVWFYKKFLGSSSNIPPAMSVPQPLRVQVLPPDTEEGIAHEPITEVAEIVKRFNIVLTLMNQGRTYRKYTIAKLAQIMHLESIGELNQSSMGSVNLALSS